MMKQFTENKKLNKVKIHASIACLSPYLQSRFFLKNCNEAKLDPLNEQRVRIWIREIYPQYFNKQDLFHENHECDSLQLEEIRAVFRALIEEHIKEEWFLDTMFTPELGESLALLLRNQRDRMLLNYHQNLNIDHPYGSIENKSIWRQVFHHIAFDDQNIDSGLWILKVTEQIQEDNLSLMDIPTVVDKVIVHILDYYEDEALMPVPASIIYNTRDPTTYETLRFDYEQRKYPMTLNLRNRPLPSRHLLLAESMSRQQCLSLPFKNNNSFSINISLNPTKAAELQRCIGPVFNISALYNCYNGFLKPFTSRSEVRHAICNIIYQEIVNIDLDIPYLDHEKPFNDIENKSLLIALLDNTIVPSFYHGRALPLCVINNLKKYIDKYTKINIDYLIEQANHYEQEVNNPMKLFINLVESDTILHITTGAFDDDTIWWNSFRMFKENIQCLYHTKCIRDQLFQESSATSLFLVNKKVITVIEEIRKDRVPSELKDNNEQYIINKNDIIYSLRNFQHQHKLFFQHYENMPRQSIPHPALRAVAYEDINKLYKNAITLSKHFSLYQYDENYIKNQRFLFDANVHEKSCRLGKSVTSSMNKPAANIIKLLGNDTDDESIYSDEKQNPLTWGTKHSYNDNDAKNNDNYDADDGDENDYDDNDNEDNIESK